MTNIPVLRPKQKLLADAVRESFRTHSAVLAVAHTAFGKTVLLSYIVASAAKKGNRVIIVAHRQELINQISGALRKFGVPHGIISPQYSPDYRQSVQVASIGTLNARFKKIPERFMRFDLMILDEAHHLVAGNTFGKAYELLNKPRLMGVTATPERGDGKGLGEGAGGVFQDMVEVTTVKASIEDGYLSDFVVFAPSTPIDLAGIKTKMGDYDKSELAERIDKPTVTGDAVREYAKRCPTYPAVVFCITVEHCEHVAAEFQANGFDFRVIDGTMDDSQRKKLIEGLGKTHMGLVSCNVISEGTDVPAIACAIFLRPTKSLGLYIQQAGRAIRPVYAEGYDLSTREGRLAALANGPKPRAVLLDHAGLCLTHGMIDEEHEWSLDGRQKSKGKKKAKEVVEKATQCKKCYAVFAPAPACPVCGELVEVKARKIDHADGDLIEITKEMRQQMSLLKKKEVKGAKTLAELERIAAERGYSPGWAKHTFEAKMKKRAQFVRPATPPPPTREQLLAMSLDELLKVEAAQGWQAGEALKFYNDNHPQALGGQ